MVLAAPERHCCHQVVHDFTTLLTTTDLDLQEKLIDSEFER